MESNKSGSSNDFDIVVAIDFGTSFSGYAYSRSSDKNKIIMNKNWASDRNMLQVPTSILFDKNQKFVAFGDDAEEQYSDFTEEEEEHQYYFFHRFKMILQQDEHLGRKTILKAANGKEMNAIDVFAEAIKFLKEHFLGELTRQDNKNKYDVNNIRWVLTVPAIWSDAAKQFMREAAMKAGLPAHRLLIALEPECAALHVLSLPDTDLCLSVGSKYILLDCGGGTIDTICHEIISEGKVKEINTASGGPWGSTVVDKEYEKYLKNILSTRVIDKFKSSYPAEWLETMRDFEKVKRSLSGCNNPLVSISPGLRSVFKKIKRKTLAKTFSNHSGLRMRGEEKLEIPKESFNEIITNIGRNIADHLNNLRDKHPGVNRVILVGGFVNSNILTGFLKQDIKDVNVFIPDDPEVAVVKGAVKYGWNTSSIQSRRSKRTYGSGIAVQPFDPDKHPQRHKINCDGVFCCKAVFDTLIQVDEEVPVGKVIERIHCPTEKKQTGTTVSIYASTEQCVNYIDDPGVELICEVDVPMPDTTGDLDRQVHIEYYFGLTEIKITALDVTSGSKVELTCDFLSY